MAALNARHFEAIAAMDLLAPQHEFHSVLTAAEGEFHVGLPGLRDWAENMDAVWANFRVEIIDFRVLDDGRVLVIYRATGEARASGVPLDTHTGQVWTFRDGKAVRNQSYASPHEAFEAVGLRE